MSSLATASIPITSTDLSTERTAGRSSVPMVVFALTLLVLVASGSAPSPLYPIYQAEWGIPALELTIVFAAYVVGLLVTLLTAGSLSDHVGRKPIVLGGLVVSLTAMGIFTFAGSGMTLIIARIVQGLAIGLVTGALGAGMIDHQPTHRPLAAFLNGVTPPVALTVGSLGSGALVQFVGAPEKTVFLVMAGLMILAGIAVALTPERSPRRPGALASLRPTVRVPASSKSLFAGVIGCMIASWALVGLYLAFAGSVLRELFDISHPLATGGIIAVFTGFGALTGIVISRFDARRSMLVGVGALIVGPIVTVAGLWGTSLPTFVVGTAIAGIGFGAGFQGGLRLLLATAPVEERAGLLSSIYVGSYLAFGLPSIAAGALVPALGLTVVLTYYAGFVIVCAVVALVLQRILRPSARAELRADAVEQAELAQRSE